MDNKDDILLSAYVDGEIDDAEAREIERRLAADGDLRKRLDAMRAADAATRKLFAAVDAAPMPDAVLRLLESKPAMPDNVVAFPQRGLSRFMQMPVAIAASVALVVGFMVSDLARQAPGPATSIELLSARSIDTESGLHRLLEQSSSGQEMDLGSGETGRALLTFEDRTGEYCRQVQVNTDASAAHAVACRRDDVWQVEALAFVDTAPDGQFQPAAGATPFTITATVDALIGTADPFEEEQENQTISNSWKKPE